MNGVMSDAEVSPNNAACPTVGLASFPLLAEESPQLCPSLAHAVLPSGAHAGRVVASTGSRICNNPTNEFQRGWSQRVDSFVTRSKNPLKHGRATDKTTLACKILQMSTSQLHDAGKKCRGSPLASYWGDLAGTIPPAPWKRSPPTMMMFPSGGATTLIFIADGTDASVPSS